MLYPSQPEWLRLKVAATNRANGLANSIYRQMADVFRKLVGQKILKADGSFTKKVEAMIPKPVGTGETGVHVWRSGSGKWAISWSVRATVFAGDEHVDAEATAYICEMGAGHDGMGSDTVKCIHNREPLKTDYDAEEILGLRAIAKQKKKEYDAAQSACYPFEERH